MVSDVVMENFTPRVMRSWGLDYPNMRKLRPDVILVSKHGVRARRRAVLGVPGAGDDAGGDARALLGHRLSGRGTGQGRGVVRGLPVDMDGAVRHRGGAAVPEPDRARPVGGHGDVPGGGDVPVGVHPGRHGQRARGRAHREPPSLAGAAGLLSSGGERPVDHAVGGRRLAVAVALRGDGTAGADLRPTVQNRRRAAREPRRAGRGHLGLDLGAGPV